MCLVQGQPLQQCIDQGLSTDDLPVHQTMLLVLRQAGDMKRKCFRKHYKSTRKHQKPLCQSHKGVVYCRNQTHIQRRKLRKSAASETSRAPHHSPTSTEGGGTMTHPQGGGWATLHHIYLEPQGPLSLKVIPPKQGLFQPKQGSFAHVSGIKIHVTVKVLSQQINDPLN